jgi:hypothetical protein
MVAKQNATKIFRDDSLLANAQTSASKLVSAGEVLAPVPAIAGSIP